jgi:protoporphyrin/coproporphyrin ferrochelatase
MAAPPKIGIVMFQLGGPDSLESVEPFLFNLFSDPDILPMPVVGGLLRIPLARYIARKRAPHVAEHYREIGGGSPIGQLTERQAAALEAALRPEFDPLVTLAMRYWRPTTEDAVARIRSAALDQLVLLPLYPQFSYATTLSSLKEWNRLYRPTGNPPPSSTSSSSSISSLPVRTVGSFHLHPLYIEALVDRINATFRHFDSPSDVHIVFSAHGIPLSLVKKGDPYPKQIEATVSAVVERGAWPNPHVLCFQSRVGPMKWLEPSTTKTLARLGAEGVKCVLIVPVAFVTEHVETLHEINIEAREIAEHAGIRQFRMMPAVGDSPKFIACLADLVRTTLAKPVARGE